MFWFSFFVSATRWRIKLTNNLWLRLVYVQGGVRVWFLRFFYFHLKRDISLFFSRDIASCIDANTLVLVNFFSCPNKLTNKYFMCGIIRISYKKRTFRIRTAFLFIWTKNVCIKKIFQTCIICWPEITQRACFSIRI